MMRSTEEAIDSASTAAADRDPSREATRRMLAVAITALAAFAFLPVVGNAFLDWDDRLNFLENAEYRGLAWANLRWAWTTFLCGVYQPLAWMALEAQYAVFGMKPSGYHLTSLILHAMNMVVFYRLTLALLERGNRGHEHESPSRRDQSVAAALAVALFAVHPLRVEVVAWVSCQPYLPCAFFAMLCVLAYLRAADASTPSAHRSWLARSWLCFVMALLSKAAAVPLPAVLLILDVYPLRRLGPGRWSGADARRVYPEKLVLFAPCAAFMALTYHARVSVSGSTLFDQYGWTPRIVQSLFGITFYVVKTVLPFGLAAYYPLPRLYEEFFAWPFAQAAVAAVVTREMVLVLVWRWPSVLAAWAAYLVILSPNLGFIWSGNYSAADRYSYLSSVPGVVLLAGALSRLASRPRPWRWALGIGLGLIVVLTALTWRQCLTWKNSVVLWRHACAVDPDNPVANLKLGLARLEEGRTGEAKDLLLKVSRFDVKNPLIYANLGAIAFKEGKPDDAEVYWNQALVYDSDSVEALNGIGLARARQGRFVEAEDWHRRALRVLPNNPEAHHDLGLALACQDRLSAAAEEFAHAVRIRPDYPEALTHLGGALAGLGKLDEALAAHAEAVRLDPRLSDARLQLERLPQRSDVQGSHR